MRLGGGKPRRGEQVGLKAVDADADELVLLLVEVTVGKDRQPVALVNQRGQRRDDVGERFPMRTIVSQVAVERLIGLEVVPSGGSCQEAPDA